jgi:glycolate oxidase iron-sulfur subunit
MLTGCVMGELFGEVHRATARVLNRRGISVEAPSDQVCCGALHAHDGDLAFARMLARRNIAAFEAGDFDAVIVNSAGCGAAMKEYGDLLAGDTRWAARARAFSARVRDLSEYLAELGASVPAYHASRVSYQDACHLAHAQGIRAEPRQLLAAVDGLTLTETAGADRCCGAAGIYSLVQPAMSAELRRRKGEELRASGAETIVTANPGCQLQYLAACAEAGLDAEVLHLAELLDRAEAAAEQQPTS